MKKSNNTETMNYSQIKTIMESIDLLEVNEKKGAHFKFPFYLTESMDRTSIDELDLSQRASNCMKRAEIYTIGQLARLVYSGEELGKIRNCGKKSVAEIMDKLFAYQYARLSPSRREKFLAEVIKLNFDLK